MSISEDWLSVPIRLTGGLNRTLESQVAKERRLLLALDSWYKFAKRHPRAPGGDQGALLRVHLPVVDNA